MGAAALDVMFVGNFWIADGAAAPSTAVALTWNSGVPDTTDVGNAWVAPTNGYIIGVTCQSAPSSGDTVIVEPTIGGTAQTGIQAIATNAAPNAFFNATQAQAVAFTAGQLLGVKYLTTTGTTYTVHDIVATLIVALNTNPPNLVTS